MLQQQVKGLVIGGVDRDVDLAFAKEVEEDRMAVWDLAVIAIEARHLENLNKPILLVEAQVMNKVVVMVAYYRSQHSRELVVCNLKPPFDQRVPDHCLPDCEVVLINVSRKDSHVEPLIVLLIRQQRHKVLRVDVDREVLIRLSPVPMLFLKTDVPFGVEVVSQAPLKSCSELIERLYFVGD